MSALTELCDTLQRARQHHQAAKEYEDMANRSYSRVPTDTGDLG